MNIEYAEVEFIWCLQLGVISHQFEEVEGKIRRGLHIAVRFR